MTVFDDDQDMRPHGSQDDELVLTGRAVPGDDALADLLTSLRTLSQEPAPAPTAALAALLRDGLPPQAVVVPLPVRLGRTVRRRMGVAGRWAAGLGLAGKVVLGAGVALAGVTGAATIPAVPDVVQRPAQTMLTEVGRVLGGGGAPSTTPSPSPSTSTTRPSDDDTTRHPATPGTGHETGGGESGADGSGVDGGTGPGGRHDDTQAPGQPGVHGQSPAEAPGRPSTGRGSSGQGSSGQEPTRTGSTRTGSTGDGSTGQDAPRKGSGPGDGSRESASSPEQGPAAGSGTSTDPVPARSPQPSSSATPRAGADPSWSSSGR